MKKILVLCTGNSCRSQMAEGWWKSILGDLVVVYSAGLEAHGINPYMKRAMEDAGIDVRRGSMTREQAVQLVRMYDDIMPEKYFEEYCDYYKMPMKEFLKVIDKWANKDLFEKKNRWVPKFNIE